MARRLLILNGMAALCAVINHATGWGFTAMFWWTDRFLPVSVPNFDLMGGFSYYGLQTLQQFIIFTIPAFMFVSGYFIAFATKRDQDTIQRKVIISRIRILVVPYILWSVLILASDYMQGASYSINELLVKLVQGKAAAPYYYIPLLIQLYLISPLIVYIAKKNWKGLLIVAILIHLVVKTLHYDALLELQIPGAQSLQWLTPSWFFPGHILWFTSGVIAGLHIKEFREFLARIKWVALVATIVLIPAGVIEWELILRNSSEVWIASRETLVDNLYALFFIFTVLAFDVAKLPTSKYFDALAPKSYGVYLVHAPVLEYTARIIYHIVPVLLGIQLILQPLLVTMGIAVPLFLMWLLAKSPARRYYQYIFG